MNCQSHNWLKNLLRAYNLALTILFPAFAGPKLILLCALICYIIAPPNSRQKSDQKEEISEITVVGKAPKMLERVKTVMEKVYGAYSGPNWAPKGFEENKSRYLWTDAYGVVNFLSLFCETRDEKYLNQAKILIQTVHDTLGKTRDGHARLPRATDDHPTKGGLRIGKPDDEGSGMLEDGQYYHYLTKWMFALSRSSLVTKDPRYNQWAVEMAKAVHPHFVRRVNGKAERMFWKLSIDLSRPLVNSEGGLDSYDGYTMYRVLQDASGDKSTLAEEISDMRHLIDGRYQRYSTHDTLDAGEALWLCSWYPQENWCKHVYGVAKRAVESMKSAGEFKGSSSSRLAFREFGTTIGVQMHDEMTRSGWAQLNSQLHEFWFKHLYERDSDITPVMYCTSLMPGLINPRYQINV